MGLSNREIDRERAQEGAQERAQERSIQSSFKEHLVRGGNLEEPCPDGRRLFLFERLKFPTFHPDHEFDWKSPSLIVSQI